MVKGLPCAACWAAFAGIGSRQGTKAPSELSIRDCEAEVCLPAGPADGDRCGRPGTARGSPRPECCPQRFFQRIC